MHQGGRRANHPVYGNVRPHQQPYRSLRLLPPSPSGTVDSDSLHFLEEALQLYQSPAAKVRQSLPGDLPEAMRRDCALLDCELLKATLESLH